MEAGGSESANENIFKSATTYKYLYVWTNVNCDINAENRDDPTNRNTNNKWKKRNESGRVAVQVLDTLSVSSLIRAMIANKHLGTISRGYVHVCVRVYRCNYGATKYYRFAENERTVAKLEARIIRKINELCPGKKLKQPFVNYNSQPCHAIRK